MLDLFVLSVLFDELLDDLDEGIAVAVSLVFSDSRYIAEGFQRLRFQGGQGIEYLVVEDHKGRHAHFR